MTKKRQGEDAKLNEIAKTIKKGIMEKLGENMAWLLKRIKCS